MSRLDDIRDEETGKLPAFAWPGGYTLVYYTRHGLTICADCANDETKDQESDPVIEYDAYWEGPTIQCDDCGKDIESSYGDPDEEENGQS